MLNAMQHMHEKVTTPLAYINGEHILCFMFHFLKTILSDPENHLLYTYKKN